MSEEQNEFDFEPSVNKEFIDLINAGEFNKARETFDAIMADKTNARLDAEKAAVAASIYDTDDDLDISMEEDDFFDTDELDDLEDEDTAEAEGKEIYSGAEI